VQRVFNTSAPVSAGIAQFQIMATTPMMPVFCLCTRCLSELNENKKGSVVPGVGVEPKLSAPNSRRMMTLLTKAQYETQGAVWALRGLAAIRVC